MDEVTGLSQQELLYVTFQPDERTIVACDLDGCELLRVPFADETEVACRQAQDVVAASVESLFPTARPLWASEPSTPVGDDYNELVAASLQQLYEEERRSWAQKERLRARKDRRIARELQLQEAMRAPAAALPTAGLGAPAWRANPLPATDSRLPAGEYPSLSAGVRRETRKRELTPQRPKHAPGRNKDRERAQMPVPGALDRLREPLEGAEQPTQNREKRVPEPLPKVVNGSPTVQKRAPPDLSCASSQTAPPAPFISQLDAAVQRVVLRVATREERRGDACPEPPSPGGLRRLMRVAEGPGRRRKSLAAAEEADDAGRDALSTKSFRKLIQDMLSKGWQPVKVRPEGC